MPLCWLFGRSLGPLGISSWPKYLHKSSKTTYKSTLNLSKFVSESHARVCIQFYVHLCRFSARLVSLQTFKNTLPPAREHDFHKIDHPTSHAFAQRKLVIQNTQIIQKFFKNLIKWLPRGPQDSSKTSPEGSKRAQRRSNRLPRRSQDPPRGSQQAEKFPREPKGDERAIRDEKQRGPNRSRFLRARGVLTSEGSLKALLVRSWALLGRSWGALGRSWGALGTLLWRSSALERALRVT